MKSYSETTTSYYDLLVPVFNSKFQQITLFIQYNKNTNYGKCIFTPLIVTNVYRYVNKKQLLL